MSTSMHMEQQETAPAVLSPTRPFYWSVRREVWENRSLWIAPLAVCAFALFVMMTMTVRLPQKIRGLDALDALKQRHTVAMPFSMIASMTLLTGIIVGAFYCVDALNSERRDRSILFWKSLPLSDRLTVLSKASIPHIVVPLFCMALTLCAQLILLVVSTLVLIGSGINPARLWMKLPLIEMAFVMLYGVTAHSLWYAPLYGWLLLISAWAKRAAFLWVILPGVVIGIIEKAVFGTEYFSAMIRYRIIGAMSVAFAPGAAKAPITRGLELTPLTFLTSSGLWLGLLFAAACLLAATRLRRNREPM